MVIADTENNIYKVDTSGQIFEFRTSVSKENRRLFLDRLQDHEPNLEGTLVPKHNSKKADHAQWLSGIAAGAWFELYPKNGNNYYRFRRISPYGHIDIDAFYSVDDVSFNYESDYRIVQYSNCLFFHVEQQGKRFKFHLVDSTNS